MGKRLWAGIVTVALVAAACSSGDDTTSSDGTVATTAPAATDPAATAAEEPNDDAAPTTDGASPDDSDGGVPLDEPVDAEIRAGVEQITLVDATPGTEYVLVPDDHVDATFTAGAADDSPTSAPRR